MIANEQEIDASEDYRRRREKLIGKTLRVQSSFEEAFSYFSSTIDDGHARKFVEAAATDITAIYEKSELNNLRILQQSIWDFERFYKAISREHRKNTDAMATLLRLLFVLSFELKAARIGEEDLLKGRGLSAAVAAHMREKNKEEPKPPMREVQARYAIDIDDDILSNELLVDFLIHGIVSSEEINAQLERSRFFVTVADEAPWRTVWHYTERSEDEFDRALEKMEAQYAGHEFKIDGEILHVLGLRLFLSDRGILNQSRVEIVAEGKKYIDDLYNAKALTIAPPDGFTEMHFRGYGGLGMNEAETPEFRELFNHLKAKQQQAFEDTYAAKAADLLEEMKTDVQQFFRHICYTPKGDSVYAVTPVLAKIVPDAFIDAFLRLHPSDQHVVMMGLKGRYEHQLNRGLEEEKAWIRAVREKLLARVIAMKPISRYRIENLVQWYIDTVLPKNEEAATAKMLDAEGD